MLREQGRGRAQAHDNRTRRIGLDLEKLQYPRTTNEVPKQLLGYSEHEEVGPVVRKWKFGQKKKKTLGRYFWHFFFLFFSAWSGASKVKCLETQPTLPQTEPPGRGPKNIVM